MASLLERLRPDEARLVRPAGTGLGPAMLATPSDRREFGDGWVLERKLDGIRALALREGDGVRLLSRGAKPLDAAFPEIAEALAAQDCGDFALDGEIVALRGDATDFSLLQRRSGLRKPSAARASKVAVTYFVFDLLRVDRADITRLPLLTRKTLLRDAVEFRSPLKFTTHRRATRSARTELEKACERGWEGLIAKRSQAPYVHRRSTDWVKLKCGSGQEFVVGGFTEPQGSRIGFGAMLLGYYQDGALRYAGKVGTGWDTAALRKLREVFDVLEQERSPFADQPRDRAVHWLRPELVAQIGFTEWTGDGLLRHPRYLGMRTDKDPGDVVREEPAGSGR